MNASESDKVEPSSGVSADEYGHSSTLEKMNNSSVKMNKKEDDIERKKNEVLVLDSKGYTQQEIAEAVKLSQPTVSRYLKEAQDAIIEPRANYVRRHVQDLHRAKMG